MEIVSASEAVALLRDGDTVVIGGSGGGHAVPEALIVALERRFLTEGHPVGITSLHPVGLGDEDTQGVGHLAHRGLLKRIVTGAFVDSPRVADLALADAIEAYTLPQGVLSALMREMAAGRPGLITRVGLKTFVDPRLGGGRQSPSATEDLVEVVTLDDREWLRYRPFDVDVAFLRGTTADEDGNITMEQEAVFGEMLSMAQATRRLGGVVVVQVRRLARRGTLPGKLVKVPGILVDLVVVDPDPWQTYETRYSPAYAGELRIPASDTPALPFGIRKVIARRAALELVPGAICNLGAGVSTGIAAVAAEEGIIDHVTLTNEQGLIGGLPAGGNDAGAATNFSAMIDQPYQFDFYDGGGLDLAFLSFAQASQDGSVNVSRFHDRIIGVGGFINISQNSKKVVFSAPFTTGGLEVTWPDGKLQIDREGRHSKFVAQVEQLTFSGAQAVEAGQPTMFVTERAVFVATSDGLELIEIAPGVDIDRDVLGLMGFKPRIAADLREMDGRIFQPQPMGLGRDLARSQAPARSARLSARAPALTDTRADQP